MAFTTINKSGDYFNTKLYTGNGGTQSITDVGFQPDLTWIKQRGGTTNHVLYDAVRGAYWTMQSNTTNSQTADDGLTAWNSGGWNMANVSTTNGNGLSYVGWNWLGANGTAANTAGSISSTVSASTTSGFSIVQWTGTGSNATVGHGLGVAPSLIITKAKNASGRFWGVYSKPLGNTGVMALNSTQAFDTSATYWNNTSPTDTLFSVGTNGDTNSASSMIAYCFADVQGYSKFGSYVGNGSTNGPFIYTGFKPAFVMGKKSSGVEDWFLFDNKRDSYNVNYKLLYPNASNAEYTGVSARNDFLSNGFKMRTTDGKENQSGQTYIYMAFASAPLVGTNNIPANAR